METRRNCGFISIEPLRKSPVWLRGSVATSECPRSYIRAESQSWLEEFHIWRLAGKSDLRSYPARTVEAFSVLESELLKERDNGNH
jgi:hypothetical protein